MAKLVRADSPEGRERLRLLRELKAARVGKAEIARRLGMSVGNVSQWLRRHRILLPPWPHEAELRRLHAEGLVDTEIAPRLGVARSVASRHRRRLGLPAQPGARHTGAGHAARQERARRLRPRRLGSGLSLLAVAREAGTTEAALSRYELGQIVPRPRQLDRVELALARLEAAGTTGRCRGGPPSYVGVHKGVWFARVRRGGKAYYASPFATREDALRAVPGLLREAEGG